MTLQSVPRAHDMLRRWTQCPDEIQACAHFKHRWPAEQGAFNEFIRYEFEELVREIPCDDALGYPGMSLNGGPSNCIGRLVNHFTLSKGSVKGAVQRALAFGVMTRMQDDLQSRAGELKVERLNFGLDPEDEST